MLDRTIQPPYTKDFKWHLPKPSVEKLSDVTSFTWLTNIHQPISKLQLVCRAGNWYEPACGVAYFAAHMLDKGTSTHTAQQLAQTFDQMGSSLGIRVGPDFTTLTLLSLNKNIFHSVDLLIELLTDPIYPQTEFDLLRSIYRQNLKISNEKNHIVASKQLKKLLFGEHHPYGKSIEETHLDQLHIDLLSNYTNQLKPTHIYITSSLDNAEVSQIKTKLKIVDSPNMAPISHTVAKNKITQTRQVKEKSIQCSIRMGKHIISQDHHDYPSLCLLNHILGGYYGARLMHNIREEKGLTYGIYSSITSFCQDSILSVGADVNKENIDLVIKEIKNELNRLCHEPIDNEELETGKNHFLGTQQLATANPFLVMAKIKMIDLFNLDKNYYTNWTERILKTEQKKLQTLASQYLDPASFHTVIVG